MILAYSPQLGAEWACSGIDKLFKPQLQQSLIFIAQIKKRANLRSLYRQINLLHCAGSSVFVQKNAGLANLSIQVIFACLASCRFVQRTG